jgi:hypothetical protein
VPRGCGEKLAPLRVVKGTSAVVVLPRQPQAKVVVLRAATQRAAEPPKAAWTNSSARTARGGPVPHIPMILLCAHDMHLMHDKKNEPRAHVRPSLLSICVKCLRSFAQVKRGTVAARRLLFELQRALWA